MVIFSIEIIDFHKRLNHSKISSTLKSKVFKNSSKLVSCENEMPNLRLKGNLKFKIKQFKLQNVAFKT